MATVVDIRSEKENARRREALKPIEEKLLEIENTNKAAEIEATTRAFRIELEFKEKRKALLEEKNKLWAELVPDLWPAAVLSSPMVANRCTPKDEELLANLQKISTEMVGKSDTVFVKKAILTFKPNQLIKETELWVEVTFNLSDLESPSTCKTSGITAVQALKKKAPQDGKKRKRTATADFGLMGLFKQGADDEDVSMIKSRMAIDTHEDEEVSILSRSNEEGEEGNDALEDCLHRNMGLYQAVALVALGLANAADSTELMVISFIMPKLDFTDTMKGVLSGSMFFGMLVGGLLAGSLSDQIGRKPCLLVSMYVNTIFGLLIIVFPHSWEWIFACRILTGVGVGGTVPVMFTIAAEITSLAYRGKFITIVCSFWMFGGVYTAGVAWYLIGHEDHPWQWLSVASQIPNVIAILLIQFYMYETPKYYIMKGKFVQASEVLRKIAAFNRKPFSDPFVEEAGRSVSTAPAEKVKPSAKESIRLVKELLTGENGRSTSLLLVVWFTLSFGWYGIILWIPKLFDQYNAGLDDYENAFMVQASNLPGNVLSAVLVDRLGRKRMLTYSMGLSCVVCTAMGFQNSLYPVVALSCAYNAVSIIGWNSLSCLSSESFPTAQRSTAIGLLSATGRVASGLSQVAFGLFFHYNVHVSIILFLAAGMMGTGSASAFWLPIEPAFQKRADDVI